MSDLVLLERDGLVATLTLNRPERHNSLVPELLHALLAALKAVQEDGASQVIRLRASGRSFSTGGDVRVFWEQRHDPRPYAAELVGLLNETILAMFHCPLPIVAAVQGIVTGGSLGLLLASDVALVAPGASITPYYGVVGFSPDGGWTAILPELIGRKRVAELLLRNGTISAAQAVKWGLASRLVAAEHLDHETMAVAREIAGLMPGSVRQSKRLLRPDLIEIRARLELERHAFLARINSAEVRAGMAAFLGESDGAARQGEGA